MPEAGDLDARLAVIRRAYIAELPRKITDLNLAWNDAQANDWQPVQVQVLHRLVHNLAGSGATFGFSVVSDCARALESALRVLLQPGPTDDVEAARNLLPTLFKALIASMDEAAKAQ